ncbi:MAG: hypothetical protein F6K41_12775 [Symploca sp. SIO3E6]|nr:hypothetical protein [Caldora sp. SIO3E6]
MKKKQIAHLLVAGLVAVQVPVFKAQNSVAAPAGTSFECHELFGHPSGSPWATFVVTSTGKRLAAPMLLWKNSPGGYTPQQRCYEVTNRLNVAVTSNGGLLSNLWLTVGRVNNQSVICYVNSNVGGGCNNNNLLLTLTTPANTRNPARALVDMVAYIITGSASGTSIRESQQPYYNLEELVDAAITKNQETDSNPSGPVNPVQSPVTQPPVQTPQPPVTSPGRI